MGSSLPQAGDVARRMVLLALAACAPLSVASEFDATLEHKLFDAANQARVQAGLPKLTWNETLALAARAHARRMADAGKLAHRLSSEPDLTDRLAGAGLHFDAAAENIARATEPDDIHSGWMNSKGHRENILGARYNELGVGVLRVGNAYFAVQDFAHTISADNGAVAEQRFAAAFKAKRKDARLPAVTVASGGGLRNSACEMARKDKPDARAVEIGAGFRAAAAYTATAPENLPEGVERLAGDSTVKAVNVGSCFMSTPQYPGGIYWFVIVY